MRVRYRNTADDLPALMTLGPAASWWWPLQVLGTTALCCLPSVLLLLLTGHFLALGLASAVIVVLLGIYLRARMSRRNLDDLPPQPETTITLHDGHWHTESDQAWCLRDWSTLHDVRQTADHLLLLTGPMEALVIPRSAFKSADEAESFAAEATRRGQAAQRPNVHGRPRWNSHMHNDAAPEAGDSISVRYEPNVDEMLDFGRNGGLPRRPPGLRMAVFLAVAAVMTLAMLLVRQPPELGAILAFPVFFVVLVPPLQLIRWWNRRRMRDEMQRSHIYPQTIAVSSHGVGYQSALEESCNDWTTVTEVRNLPDHISILLEGGRIFHLIPKTAFNDREEATRFFALANDHVREAAESAKHREAVPMVAPRLETGNPYESPGEG